MTNQEQKKDTTDITPQPDAESKKQSTELSEEELNEASGGIVVTKPMDIASPKLNEG